MKERPRGPHRHLAPLASLLIAALIVGGFAAPAAPAAAAGEAVTLTSTRGSLVYGASVVLSGEIVPALEGESVSIVDVPSGEEVVPPVVTDADGAFEAVFQPEANATLKAVWTAVAAESDEITILVRPKLSVSLTRVRLFERALVRGTIRPQQSGGETVLVRLYRGSRVVGRRTARLKEGRRFRARFRIKNIGRYQARVRFQDDDEALRTAKRRSGRRRAPLPPSLSEGSRGRNVKRLEWRLRRLQYRLPNVDLRFDHRTGDGVLAFHKVQGMGRVRSVSSATWRRLISPFRPRPVNRLPRFHIEIDQSRQVLYVVRRGRIDEIVHTSTGAGGATHNGVFSVHRKIAGYSPGRLYYPSYFDGNRAVHGWPQVPTYPASHGCARVPNWTAIWLHDLMPHGTQVRVYHS